jgi:hypothetical protein
MIEHARNWWSTNRSLLAALPKSVPWGAFKSFLTLCPYHTLLTCHDDGSRTFLGNIMISQKQF